MAQSVGNFTVRFQFDLCRVIDGSSLTDGTFVPCRG